jgi:hypothetical protein
MSARPFFALGLCLLLVASCGGSQVVGSEMEPGVVFLGQREVDFRADRDILHVGRDTGAFRQLRFVVRDAPIALYDVKVEFGNGQIIDVPTRLEFRRGSMSREIDLPGDQRFIRNISFVYETLGRRQGRARVQVLGIR